MINNNITPLEKATGIIITSPNDIIMGWEGASKLLYCYKNNIDLIQWTSLLSDDFINNCADGDFNDLSDHMKEDLLQIGLYLNMMKVNDWSIKVDIDDIIKTANIIIQVVVAAESVNRTVIKELGEKTITGSGKIINVDLKKDNKYDINSYELQINPKINIELI